jgi:hypothetical protein
MGLFYTKKKEDTDEKTVPTTEFIRRMVSNNKDPEKETELPRTETEK